MADDWNVEESELFDGVEEATDDSVTAMVSQPSPRMSDPGESFRRPTGSTSHFTPSECPSDHA